MKVLYSRMARGRKRQYQVITKIVLIDGEKYALKEAACTEAQKHVEHTFYNESIMESVYGDYLQRGRWVEEKILTPFVAGETLGGRLRECLEKRDGMEEARNLFQLWRQLIVGRKENLTKFVPSKEFEEVFGSTEDLEGIEATMISNFDCSAENIFFLPDGGVKIIDYEWVFSFAIPVEMSFYRVLKIFYECNRGILDWKKLLELAAIEETQSRRYERMIDAFAEYTSVDSAANVNYAFMGKKFKTGKILERNKQVFQYRFPYDLIPESKEVVLYGAGCVGEDFYKLINLTEYCQIVLWADKSAQHYRKQGLNVSDVEEIRHCTYDYILVAVYQKKIAEQIRQELESYGVDPAKIVWGKYRLL